MMPDRYSLAESDVCDAVRAYAAPLADVLDDYLCLMPEGDLAIPVEARAAFHSAFAQTLARLTTADDVRYGLKVALAFRTLQSSYAAHLSVFQRIYDILAPHSVIVALATGRPQGRPAQ